MKRKDLCINILLALLAAALLYICISSITSEAREHSNSTEEYGSSK